MLPLLRANWAQRILDRWTQSQKKATRFIIKYASTSESSCVSFYVYFFVFIFLSSWWVEKLFFFFFFCDNVLIFH